ncbi:MAG: cation:proton antiporter [Pseudomonadota bacterium]
MESPDLNPLLLLALVLVAGTGGGILAKWVRLPEVTGQILIGVALGATGISIFQIEHIESLQPITSFALGLIAVTVGSHLNLRRLHNAYRRLLWLVLLEASLTPLLVFAGTTWLGQVEWTLGLLLATMAVATAPATVVALVKETRSRGVFVKTLIGAVALNNLACIALFEIAHAVVELQLDPTRHADLWTLVASPARALLLSGLLGAGVGVVTVLGTRHLVRTDQLTTASLVAILVTSGLADLSGLSSLLACLFLGLTLANLTPDKDEVGHGVFADFEHGIYAAFFTLAGLELDLHLLPLGGMLALLYVILRYAGKLLAANLAMRLAGATDRVRRNLGLALAPQAGLAIGLIVLVQGNLVFAELRELFLAVGLSSVVINEIVGPVMVRWALGRSGDLGKDRARLIDFLHEENIIVDLKAATKEEALQQLVDHLVRSNRLQVDKQALLRSVLEREAEISTCLGEGLAIPHGLLDEGDAIVGAMGLSRDGLAFETPDGLPVHCMVLLATPESCREHHLEVLAALARAIAGDRHIQRQLYGAHSAAHVSEILHAEEASEDFNYFLEDEQG